MQFISIRWADDVLVAYVSQPDAWMRPGGVAPVKESLEAAMMRLGEELLGAAEQAPAGGLVLDFSDVQYMSSTFVGKLLVLRKKCLASKKPLSIVNASPEVKGVFAVLKLNTLFDIRDTPV